MVEFKRLRVDGPLIKADGHISKGLYAAITSAIRQGLIERDGPRRIKLAGG